MAAERSDGRGPRTSSRRQGRELSGDNKMHTGTVMLTVMAMDDGMEWVGASRIDNYTIPRRNKKQSNSDTLGNIRHPASSPL